MKQHTITYRFLALLAIVLLAALSRILPHPPNFTPVGALALFGAAYFIPRWLAIAAPLLGLFLSDLVLNNLVYAEYQTGFVWFSGGFLWIYGSFVVISLLGFAFLQRISAGRIAALSIMASVLFFVVTNFGVWLGSGLYPQTVSGLVACYTAAIPFFANTLLGDLFYSAAMFGSFALLQKSFPLLAVEKGVTRV
ncbi:MAG TPA: hypothetical protein PK239_14080 [Chitinophagales bacterium]|nr:hypothetical protein [Chitinophagales bacterium]HRK28399.1 hypothetical protein [Chitinophagales bacterium]